MSSTTPKAISARDLAEVWTRGDERAVDALYAAQFVDHDPSPELPSGREGVKALSRALHEAFAELAFEADLVIGEGEIVARRWTMRGVHRGPFLGVPPTGKPVTMTGIDVLRVKDGRIVEMWHTEDVAGVLGQLGALPRSAAA